jgi:hypothetical protein
MGKMRLMPIVGIGVVVLLEGHDLLQRPGRLVMTNTGELSGFGAWWPARSEGLHPVGDG